MRVLLIYRRMIPSIRLCGHCQLEQLAAAVRGKPARKRLPVQLPAELGELQEKIRMKTGLKSSLTGSISKGKIVLQYSSRGELERLNEILDMIGE